MEVETTVMTRRSPTIAVGATVVFVGRSCSPLWRTSGIVGLGGTVLKRSKACLGGIGYQVDLLGTPDERVVVYCATTTSKRIGDNGPGLR